MSGHQKIVLVVEDESFIRESFADYFEDCHWQALLAESGEQALQLLDKESPHGAIVDIRLPGMDGNTFIRKAYRKKPKLVFIICTGSLEYEIPTYLQNLSRVSQKLFIKPVVEMSKLRDE